MKDKLKRMLFGFIVTGVSLICSIVFTFLLVKTKFLTLNIILVLAAAILLVTAGVFLLTKNSKRKILAAIGVFLAVILLAVEIFSGFYVMKGANALNDITTPEKELSEIGIYVRADDAAENLDDVKGKVFGIIETLDRSSTDLALSELKKLFGAKPETSSFEGITELLDGLIEGEIKVILLSNSLLDLLEDEIENYEEVYLNKIKEIHTLLVETPDDKVSSLPELPKKDDGAFILYITGIDTRSSRITKKSRSDVNILAAINPKTGQIALIFTPRDYYVPLSISKGIPDKLTHSGVYGVQCSIDTMEMLYDIDIDYYFKLNFVGFKNIIDALGGITVESDIAFTTLAGRSFVKGPNFVDGATALDFASARKTVPLGDRHRGIHQMAVIDGVIDKVLSPAILTNYSAFLDSIKGSFETDVPYDLVAQLVRDQLALGTKWNIVHYSTNGTGSTQKPYSLSQKAYVMFPDQTTVDKAKSIIKQVLDGEIPTVE